MNTTAATHEVGAAWETVYDTYRRVTARIDPLGRTGQSLDRVSVPARRVLSCCFGGENSDHLFITTAWEDCDKAARDADPLAAEFWFRRKILNHA